MVNIKFGTDGWRAVIAKDFTVDNVARVAQGVAAWLIKEIPETKIKIVVIGYDCRFGGKMFAETMAKVLACNNICVYLSENFVSTPMVSYGVVALEADLGIVITASHNSYEYNGIKLKSNFGGPLPEDKVLEIEDFIPDFNPGKIDHIDIDSLIAEDLIEYYDLESLYLQKIEENFDLNTIRNSNLKLAFNAMYGSGQNIMRRLFPDITHFHSEVNPLFNGIAPEPLAKNLSKFMEKIALSGNIDCGLAVDGDADRIALVDNLGRYIDSHHVMLLLIHYLAKYKGLTGKVVTGISSTTKIEKLCQHYGLEVVRVKIGFKSIAEYMIKDDVLLGGEESGGIAIKGFIPERDGIWNGLTLWEFMAKSGKSLETLIKEVYDITGAFAFERSDLKISDTDKKRIVECCAKDQYKSFGKYKVKRVDRLDGYKYIISENEWIMIRPSGTEPLLRTYAEAKTQEDALALLNACYNTIFNE